MLDLRMPGVVTVEKSVLPPTVAPIPSAVPVFIGYTEKAEKKGDSLLNIPVRIKSMKDYEDLFGGAPKVALEVEIDDRNTNPLRPEVKALPPGRSTFQNLMYHSMLFYYANGGGPCYILSVGDYDDKIDGDTISAAINELKKIKEITIIVFPDGISLPQNKYQGVITKALTHCEWAKSRVTIIDVHTADGDTVVETLGKFEDIMPTESDFKRYGMSYYPIIDTIFGHAFDPASVVVTKHLQTPVPDAAEAKRLSDEAGKLLKTLNDANTAKKAAAGELVDIKQYRKSAEYFKKKLEDFKAAKPAATDAELIAELKRIATEEVITIPPFIAEEIEKANAVPLDILKTAVDTKYPDAEIDKVQKKLDDSIKPQKDAAKAVLDGVKVQGSSAASKPVYIDLTGLTLADMDKPEFKDFNLYVNKIRDAIANLPVSLPPCGAIAGIYVRTDAVRGVWKAPANVTVFGGIKAAIQFDDDDHANLNAPPSGKTINAIRAYPGRGLLVYGARTLDGNSLEWRYVNVRRTFSFIEASVANAMQDFVFEPNNQETWIKVKSMIKSFLNRLWKAGGLYGNTPEEAYEVECEVPITMNVEEMLSGIMRVFIKVAVARPAEFIILEYTHKFELPAS